jgi:hypothetical protein
VAVCVVVCTAACTAAVKSHVVWGPLGWA